MANYKESAGYCPHCQRQVVGRREEASHTFWLIATLFSCGLFAIIWMISSLVKATKPFYCSVCGTPLQGLPTNVAIPARRKSIDPALIAVLVIVIFGIVIIGVIVSTINGSIKQNKNAPLASATPTSPSAPSSSRPASTPLPQKTAIPNSQTEAQMRRAWAAQYQVKLRKDFTDAVCSVSGQHNAILHVRTFAVVNEVPIQTLADSGYYDEVWEQGFIKIVFEDTVGHGVELTHER